MGALGEVGDPASAVAMGVGEDEASHYGATLRRAASANIGETPPTS